MPLQDDVELANDLTCGLCNECTRFVACRDAGSCALTGNEIASDRLARMRAAKAFILGRLREKGYR
jgi:hypothetical protein